MFKTLTVVTESGSQYSVEVTIHPRMGFVLKASKAGVCKGVPVIGMFPDRMSCFEDTVRFEPWPDGRVAGFNKKGVRTLLFVPDQLRLGMILANKSNGLRSTRIVKIY